MRALVCHEHGHYKDLVLETDWPAPTPGPDQVLIDVHATGVGFANILQIAGTHQNKSNPPFIPGTEAAGIVRACGENVTGFAPGTRVIGAAPGGGFAEQTVVSARLTHAIPDAMSFAQATLFPTIYGTAYISLVTEARLQAGETLLVLGAAGATGAAAVQIGRALGATVIACASSDEKRAAATKGGAHHVLDASGFKDAVNELTEGRGADVVFDPVGGDAFSEALRCTAPQGRMLAIGFASGDIPKVPLNLLLVKNIAVHGIFWGYYTGWARQKPSEQARQAVENCYRDLFDYYDKGQLDPPVHAQLPLKEFVQALEILEHRGAIGKVVLLPHE